MARSSARPPENGRQQPAAAPANRRHHSLARIWLPVVAFFVALEIAFRLGFWNIPKVSPSDADYGYQFALDIHRLHQPERAGQTRVLAFGSSISGSFDAAQVEGLIASARPKLDIDVHRLMLPGIHPADYLTLFESGEIPPPEVAILMFNLVDFLYSASDREMNPTLRYVIPPRALLRERGSSLSFSDKLDVALSAISELYRYRKLVRAALQDNFRALRRWLGSTSPPSYGVYADGYTQREFAIEIASDGPAAANGTYPAHLDYFIDAEWLRQRGKVQLEFRSQDNRLATTEEVDGGWKRVELPLPAARAVVEVTADSVWNPRAGRMGDDLRLLAVKLKDPPAQASDRQQRFRYRLNDPRDIEPFLRLKGKRGEDFERAWSDLIGGNSRFAQRTRLYREAKLAVRDKRFEENEDYRAIRLLVAYLTDHGSRVILINTPESPLLLPQYQDSEYYKAYRDFFRGLAQRNQQVSFFDLSDTMPAEDFNDWHHLNYVGAIKLGRLFANFALTAIPPAPSHDR